MDSNKNTNYAGHSENSDTPKDAPTGFSSPATVAPLKNVSNATSVNVKNPTGHTGGESRK